MLQAIILLIVLIFLNAIFASAELAVLSVNETKLKKMNAEGNARARKLTKLTEQPARFLATIQVAITLAGFLQSAFAADTFAGPLVQLLVKAGVGISQSVLNSAAIVVITIILSFFTLVFGELVPKRLAMKKAESMALGMSGMLYAVAKIFAPLVWLLTVSTNGVLRLLGIDPNEEDEQVTEEEIKMMLSESNEQGNIQEEEKELIQNVFEFNDISADAICTHRRDVVMLHMEDTDEDWNQTIFDNRHTYYPVCGETTDEIIAVLDSRDYFRLEDKSRKNLMSHAVEEPYFVPETMRANQLFKAMKRKRRYFAIVIDEYGSMSGVVSLHDLVESLVGELMDPEDVDQEPDIITVSENEWRVSGAALLRDIALETEIVLEDDECDTINGYVCMLIGRVPKDGEHFTCETDKAIIKVLGVKNHMVDRAILSRKTAVEPEKNEDSDN